METITIIKVSENNGEIIGFVLCVCVNVRLESKKVVTAMTTSPHLNHVYLEPPKKLKNTRKTNEFLKRSILMGHKYYHWRVKKMSNLLAYIK